MKDNLVHLLISGLPWPLSKCLSLIDKSSSDPTSPQEHYAIYRNLTNYLSILNSYPSAILVEIETATHSIWFLTENIFDFSNKRKTSLTITTLFFQTYKSSNFSMVCLLDSITKKNIICPILPFHLHHLHRPFHLLRLLSPFHLTNKS